MCKNKKPATLMYPRRPILPLGIGGQNLEVPRHIWRSGKPKILFKFIYN